MDTNTQKKVIIIAQATNDIFRTKSVGMKFLDDMIAVYGSMLNSFHHVALEEVIVKDAQAYASKIN